MSKIIVSIIQDLRNMSREYLAMVEDIYIYPSSSKYLVINSKELHNCSQIIPSLFKNTQTMQPVKVCLGN